MTVELTTCFECDAIVPVDEWATHECPDDELDGYDPAEPWMDVDDFDEEAGA